MYPFSVLWFNYYQISSHWIESDNFNKKNFTISIVFKLSKSMSSHDQIKLPFWTEFKHLNSNWGYTNTCLTSKLHQYCYTEACVAFLFKVKQRLCQLFVLEINKQISQWTLSSCTHNLHVFKYSIKCLPHLAFDQSMKGLPLLSAGQCLGL